MAYISRSGAQAGQRAWLLRAPRARKQPSARNRRTRCPAVVPSRRLLALPSPPPVGPGTMKTDLQKSAFSKQSSCKSPPDFSPFPRKRRGDLQLQGPVWPFFCKSLSEISPRKIRRLPSSVIRRPRPANLLPHPSCTPVFVSVRLSNNSVYAQGIFPLSKNIIPTLTVICKNAARGSPGRAGPGTAASRYAARLLRAISVPNCEGSGRSARCRKKR